MPITFTHASPIHYGNTWDDAQTFSALVTANAGITGTTIDAGTDFTIGDTVIIDGVITDSTGLALAANVTVTGNVLPAADDTYDLGSASAAWQDLFLEGDITLTDAGTISTTAGDLTLAPATGTVLVNVGTGTELGSTILLLDASSGTGQTSSTNETTLYTYTLPADTIVNTHDAVFYHASGTFGSGAYDRTLTAYFGARTLGTYTTNTASVAWDVTVMAYSSGAGNQRIITTISVNGIAQDIEYDAPAGVNDETGAIVLAIKGTAANDGVGQIVKRLAYTEFRGMP